MDFSGKENEIRTRGVVSRGALSPGEGKPGSVSRVPPAPLPQAVFRNGRSFESIRPEIELTAVRTGESARWA